MTKTFLDEGYHGGDYPTTKAETTVGPEYLLIPIV
jgi:hypothetical protein